MITSGAEAGRTVEGSGRSAKIAVDHDKDGFLARLTGVIDRTTSSTFSRLPTVSIDASSTAGCKLSTEALTSGPAVVELPSAGTAVAVGSLVSDHSDNEINQYLATSPTSPPDWFPLLTLVQALAAPSNTYIDLRIGTYDVVCFVAGGSIQPKTTGRAVLHISPAGSSPDG